MLAIVLGNARVTGSAATPSPLVGEGWGGGVGGRIAAWAITLRDTNVASEHFLAGIHNSPPPLTPPHEGEGNSTASVGLWRGLFAALAREAEPPCISA